MAEPEEYTILANELEAAAADHVRAFPNGDWKSVNQRLGALRRRASELFPELNCMVDSLGRSVFFGNAAVVRFLRERA